MNDELRTARGGLSRRDILVGLGTVAAGLPMAQMATAAADAPPVNSTVTAESGGDPVTRINKRGEDEGRGIPPRYTRVSIGLEEPEDIIADLRQAIAKCG